MLAVGALGAAVGAGGWWAVEGDEDVRAAGDGAAVLRPSGSPVTIALAGELSPGFSLGRLVDPPGFPAGFPALLGEADLAVVDLSAAVVRQPPVDPGPAAWVPAGALDVLEAAGVDVVSLANDRAVDLGPAALADALATRDGRRLVLAGIGVDEAEAYRPVVREVGGVDVAVIAATQQLVPERIATDTAGPTQAGVASAKRLDRLVAEVAAAAAQADVVVAYLHWGEPDQACPSAGQLELASALVAAGADVVAGTGSGTVQGAGTLDGAVVAYGLGALVGDGATEGGALVVEVDDGGVTGWRYEHAGIVEGVAQPAPPDDARAAELAARRECALLAP